MRRFILVATLVLAGVPSLTAARTLPVNVDLQWTAEVPQVCPVDLDGDSVDEILELSGGYLVVVDQRLKVVSRSWSYDGSAASAGGSGQGLWLAYMRSDSALVKNLSTDSEMYVVQGRDRVPPKGWQGAIIQAEVCDINNDGHLELVVAVNTGFELKPRAIIVMDWQTGRQLWRYDIAPSPKRFIIQDLDGDKKAEILVGTAAPGNGNTEDTLTDMYSYVLCLGCDGGLRWMRQIGDYGQTADIALLGAAGSEQPRLLVCEIGVSIPGAEPDSLFVLDAIAGTLLATSSVALHNEAFAVAAQPDGSSRIYVANSDSSLRALDVNLKVVSQARLEDGCPWMHAARFTGRRVPEVALLTIGGDLMMYDKGLSLLVSRRGIPPESIRVTYGEPQRPIPVRTRDRVRLLVATGRGQPQTWSLCEFSTIPRTPSVGLLAGIVLGFVAAFVGTLYLLRQRRDRDVRSAISSLSGQAGVVELDRRGQVTHCNARAAGLLAVPGEAAPRRGRRLRADGALLPISSIAKAALADAVGSPPREAAVTLGHGKMVMAKARRMRFGVLLTLEDMTADEYVDRMTSWGSMAQRLAHGIKNPLTAISLALQQLEQHCSPESVGLASSMKGDIERLGKMADGFMRFARLEPPELEPTDLNGLLRECVGRFGSAKPAGVSIKYELAQNLPLVPLDKEQMASACSNIIENAISAIGDSGVLTVRTSVADSGKRLAVSVRDTGKGIPERYLNKVFEPYFTLKRGGTGLGLCITKKIIEEHRGTISIESPEGVGTTVTITLPAEATHA